MERDAEIAQLLAATKSVYAGKPPTREGLVAVLGLLERVAEKRDLWSNAEYPLPAGEREALYLVSEEPDLGFAVYLNVMAAGNWVAPHNHTTWACVAAVDGCEHNYLYERLDDGSLPGHARLRKISTVRVEPGRSIALMPDDIHAIEGKDAGTMRHLHFYGRALEALGERLIFDPDANTCTPMPITVALRR